MESDEHSDVDDLGPSDRLLSPRVSRISPIATDCALDSDSADNIEEDSSPERERLVHHRRQMLEAKVKRVLQKLKSEMLSLNDFVYTIFSSRDVGIRPWASSRAPGETMVV
jgi:hypothetical protein